jgi:hypothetical protein
MSGIAADGVLWVCTNSWSSQAVHLQVSRPLIGFPGPHLEVIKPSSPLKGF